MATETATDVLEHLRDPARNVSADLDLSIAWSIGLVPDDAFLDTQDPEDGTWAWTTPRFQDWEARSREYRRLHGPLDSATRQRLRRETGIDDPDDPPFGVLTPYTHSIDAALPAEDIVEVKRLAPARWWARDARDVSGLGCEAPSEARARRGAALRVQLDF